jgi:hypothetical protein
MVPPAASAVRRRVRHRITAYSRGCIGAPHWSIEGHAARSRQEIRMGRAITISQHPSAAQRGANLPEKEDDPSRLQKAKDGLRQLLQRPSSGRTTGLGRRVEKPGTGRQSGPSGQTDSVQHDKKHANK